MSRRDLDELLYRVHGVRGITESPSNSLPQP